MKTLSHFIGVCIIIGIFFHYGVTNRIKLISFENGTLQICDFAYYITLAKAFWFEGVKNIYSLEAHQKIWSQVTGTEFLGAMPLGITPVALVVFFPFAALGLYSLDLSYTVWVSLSVTFFLFSLYQVSKRVQRSGTRFPILFYSCLLVLLVSETTYRGIILGQTALLTSSLILLLVIQVSECSLERKTLPPVIWALMVPILAIKPPVLFIGLIILLVFGFWKELVKSLLVIGIFLSLMTLMLGISWPKEYLSSLSIFGDYQKVAAYKQAFSPETMNIFSTAFSSTLGLSKAMRISSVIFTIGLIMSFILAAVVRYKRTRSDANKSLNQECFVICLVISIYLLFAPYAGAYEDLLLMVPVSIWIMLEFAPKRLNLASALFIVVLLVLLNHNLLRGEGLNAVSAWITKLAFLAFILLSSNRRLFYRSHQP